MVCVRSPKAEYNILIITDHKGVTNTSPIVLNSLSTNTNRPRKRKNPDSEKSENIHQLNQSVTNPTLLQTVKMEAVSAEELAEMNHTLQIREMELRKRRTGLDARDSELDEREESLKKHEAQTMLDLLEETHQCPL